MKAGIAASVALTGMIGCGQATAGDGNELLYQCEIASRLESPVQSQNKARVNEYEQLQNGLCIGLIQGVHQTMTNYASFLPKEQRICVPEGTTNGDMMNLVIKYLKDHPAWLKNSETPLVMAAYLHNFPCK